MYIPKGTAISYRSVKIKNDKNIEQEMILIDKDVFESMIITLGFEKKEQKEQKD
jgi:hypothetical protein